MSKKVSVQFNLEVVDDVTHDEIRRWLRVEVASNIDIRKMTSVQINNISGGSAEAGRDA